MLCLLSNISGQNEGHCRDYQAPQGERHVSTPPRVHAKSQQHWQIPQPILVCAHTNVAVDNVLAGLRAHGVKAVRFGSEQSMREDLEDHSFSTACSRHPLYTTHEYIKADKERLEKEQMEEATKLRKSRFYWIAGGC